MIAYKHVFILPHHQNAEAGQALREHAPEIRKEITGEQPDPYAPIPIFHPNMQHGIPPPLPSVSYSPNNLPMRGMDPPEAEGVSGYRQPPLPYSYDRIPSNHSGRGPSPSASPHYYPQQYSGRGGYHPQQQQYPPPQQYPQSYPHQGSPHYGMPPPQRQAQFTGGPRNRFGAPISTSDRRGDFPSLAMSTATDFSMSDVSEFTPVPVRPFHETPPQIHSANQPPLVHPANQRNVSALDCLEETTQPLEVATARQSSSDKSSLAVSELSVSGLKASGMAVDLVTPKEDKRLNKESTLNMSMGLSLSRNYSFPDLFLSTGDLLDEEDEKNNPNLNNGGANHKTTQSGRLFRQSSLHKHSSSGASSIDSLKIARGGFHPARGRNNTEVSGLQDAMSLMSMDHQSFKSEASWLEAAKSMQSISSEMNPWGSQEGNSLKMRDGVDDGSVRSLLSDMSNDLHALDLAEPPLLPPIHHADSVLEDSAGFVHRPDP